MENDLYLRIRDVGERVAPLQQPAAAKMLVNPGFEQPPDADDPLPGWEMREQAGATAEFDAEQKYAGEQSLRFASTQAGCIVGERAVCALAERSPVGLGLARVADPARQPPLRLAVGGRWKGQDYYRYAPVGQGTGQAIGTEWTQYLFEVRDLPAEQLTDLRVRFDLTGPGEVWIDDVELREFDEQEIRELKKMITLASYMLESRQLGDCLRLLDGYWPRFLVANVPLAPERWQLGRATCLRDRRPASSRRRSKARDHGSHAARDAVVLRGKNCTAQLAGNLAANVIRGDKVSPAASVSDRPASTCRCKWSTDWPASGPQLITTR